jgi:predicted Zn-dependent protease
MAYLLLAPAAGLRRLLGEEPHITVSPLNKLSDEDEIELGRRIAAALEKEETAVSNAAIDHYLGKMVAGLAAKSQRPELLYSINLVNSHVPNAYALPGGWLSITRGLVELMGSESELAAALSHLIGHVVGRHPDNRLLLAFAARSQLKPLLDNLHAQNDVVEKLIQHFGGATALLDSLRFSPRDEEQADLLGFYAMLRAGWNPSGFLKLFAHLDAWEKTQAGKQIPFFASHPQTSERDAAIQRELKLVAVPAEATIDSVKFQVFKSAMGLLVEPPRLPAGQRVVD